MKFSVKTPVFLKELQKVANIVPSRPTLPVLLNILISAHDNGRVTITSTDLEIRISTDFEADIESEGTTTLPAKRLLGLVSKFKGDTVLIDSGENFHTKIKCGTAEFTMLGLHPADFPDEVHFEAKRTVTMKCAAFARVTDRISYAVSFEDARKVLHGILFSVREKMLSAVTTDGKRLAVMEIPVDMLGEDGDSIFTLKSVLEAKRCLPKDGEIALQIGEKNICFCIGETAITAKTIEGQYPNYKAVIPQNCQTKVSIPTEIFSEKLEIVSVPLFDSSAYVNMTLKENTLTFEANSINIGEGHDSMEIEYNGDEFKASFNPQYLADPFRHCDTEKMTMKINNSDSPLTFESGDGFLYVIMPMRKN